MSEWTVVVYSPGQWLTANQDRHHHSRAKLRREWRTSVVAACLRAGIPAGLGVTPVLLAAEVVYTSPRAPVRDRLNLADTIKAVVDGLTPQRVNTRGGAPVVYHGHGLLPDDSDQHVINTTWTMRRARPGELHTATGAVYLTITHQPPQETLADAQPADTPD